LTKKKKPRVQDAKENSTIAFEKLGPKKTQSPKRRREKEVREKI